MPVVAISRIRHGAEDGSVKEFNIGDTLSGFNDDELRNFVQTGAAVETGKNRKFSEAPYGGGAPVDEETQKRDALIAKSQGIEIDDDERAPSEGERATEPKGATRSAGR